MRKLIYGLLFLLLAGFAAFWAAIQFAPEPTIAYLVDLERKRSGLTEKTVDIPGFRIHYLEGGSGDPLLLIHGFGANKENWTRIARHLTPHYRVIALDLPGFGESSKPADAMYRYQDQIPRLQAFTEALGLEQFHVGGNSMGGYFSAGLAVAEPRAVKSLWLLAPGGVHGSAPSEMMMRIANGEPVPLLASTAEEFDKIFGFVMSSPPWVPGFYRAVLAEQAVQSYALNEQIFRQIRLESPALEDQVNGLKTPTLIVWGEEDRVLHPSGAKVLASRMPAAEVILMPGIGHMPMLEAERDASRDYLAFRKNLQGASR